MPLVFWLNWGLRHVVKCGAGSKPFNEKVIRFPYYHVILSFDRISQIGHQVSDFAIEVHMCRLVKLLIRIKVITDMISSGVEGKITVKEDGIAVK